MRTNQLFPILIILMIVNSCASPEMEESIDGSELNYSELTSELKTKFAFIEEETTFLDSTTVNLINEIPEDRDDLEKMRTVVKTFDGSTNAGITVPGFGGITLGEKETSLSVYYIETKVVNNDQDSIVYGCGYSVHYLFKKVKRGLDLSDIPSISASVHLENRKTQVYYSLQTYGIISQNLVRYFKPTVNKKFDVEGFGIMQSSIDGIHNILGDSTLSKSVRFNPEILKFVKAYELEQI